MRLLNVDTLQVEDSLRVPPYAILSHCWGEGEVTFQDIKRSDWQQMPGAKKIIYACRQCKNDNLSYMWIDTCCIDKSSSAELSEAINSMFNWYQQATICYAYLEDVVISSEYTSETQDCPELRKSRWFTRGWTLQELIAPEKILFFGNKWSFLGNKKILSGLLSSITTVPEEVLAEPSRRRFCSIAKRMCWAAARCTTRPEDAAYSLLGIFEVHMPLLYGEGPAAFIRLQEEIMKQIEDQSIFAWGLRLGYQGLASHYVGALAQRPARFFGSEKVVPFPRYPVAMLDCQLEDDFSGALGIALRKTPDPVIFVRRQANGVDKYSPESYQGAEVQTIYISKHPWKYGQARRNNCLVRTDSMTAHGYQITAVYPTKNFSWNQATQVLALNFEDYRDSANRAGSRRRRTWVALAFHNAHTGHDFCVVLNLTDKRSDVNFQDLRGCVTILPTIQELLDLLDRDSRTLKDWLEEGNKKCIAIGIAHFWHEQNIQNTKHKFMASICKEEVLNQEVIVLDVSASINRNEELKYLFRKGQERNT
ncbi:hypothetical protein G7Y89_g5548 [Cudoniella acicularis]|uniref:Heterokaryon incompatibility domain-containing protein n=1 Tax=Cudoniella acicularis TaxID=354080 RepID=A0A8H4RQG8_9HELO|nr:hypothetical protein G7Y89_g5548 [Cudoniella acicularis]